MVQDRLALAVAASLLSRRMSDPLEGDEVAVKSVIRCLLAAPALVSLFPWQQDPERICVLTDSAWAGDKKTRRSTSGGIVLFGGHPIQFWCRQQAGIAPPSGEAELNSLTKGASEGLAVKNLLEEFGISLSLDCYCDSSSARGIAQRLGAGKVKHLEVKQLWIQEKTKSGQIATLRTPRSQNCADALTHPITQKEMWLAFPRLGLHVRAL